MLSKLFCSFLNDKFSEIPPMEDVDGAIQQCVAVALNLLGPHLSLFVYLAFCFFIFCSRTSFLFIWVAHYVHSWIYDCKDRFICLFFLPNRLLVSSTLLSIFVHGLQPDIIQRRSKARLIEFSSAITPSEWEPFPQLFMASPSHNIQV